MAYRLRYTVSVEWEPPGRGLGMALQEGAGPGPTGGQAQVLTFFDANPPPNSSTFLAADVTALTNAMAADIAAQMSVASVLTRVQNFATGGG